MDKAFKNRSVKKSTLNELSKKGIPYGLLNKFLKQIKTAKTLPPAKEGDNLKMRDKMIKFLKEAGVLRSSKLVIDHPSLELLSTKIYLEIMLKKTPRPINEDILSGSSGGFVPCSRQPRSSGGFAPCH